MTNRDHLTKERLNARQREHGDCEYACVVCTASVTVDPRTGAEYGHWGDCPHRDSSLRGAPTRGKAASY